MAKKILIIDDESDLVETITFRLEAGGYEVVSAGNGKKGLETAEREMPDLILLDIMMPEMDGYEVCKRVKSDEKMKHIPVILLTAKGQKSDREIGEKLGASDYVIKPFEASELLEKIKVVLGK